MKAAPNQNENYSKWHNLVLQKNLKQVTVILLYLSTETKRKNTKREVYIPTTLSKHAVVRSL